MKRARLHIIALLMISAIVISSAFTKDINVAQAATSAGISDKTLSLELGHYKTLKISGTTKKASWNSSNTWVATVTSGGKVTAKAAGTATITATVDGKKLTCKLSVIRLKQKTLTLAAGSSQFLTLQGASGTVAWSSSDPEVVSVTSNGKVTGNAPGTATVTALVAGKAITSQITVMDLNYKDFIMEVGGFSGYFRILDIAGATGKITWTSSDKSVVTVSSSGKVLAQGPGSATVTGSVDGYVFTSKIKVVSENVRQFTLKMGETKQLEIFGTDSEVVWHSNKHSVALVTSDGVVSTVAPGTATIMAYVDDRNVMAKVTVVP